MKTTERFSDRVENYIRYRPSYPIEAIDFIVAQFDDPTHVVCADFGSGTGILSELLVPRIEKVYGIEPNQEMRSAGEIRLRQFSNFVSVNGTAENSNLPSRSVMLVTVAQAFHWFDQARFKLECKRILQKHGLVALIWNSRLTNTSFLRRYDELLSSYANDYNEVNHQNITDEQLTLFFDGGFETRNFENKQVLDLEGLFGRLDSSSYAPKPGMKNYVVLRSELKKAFDENQIDGTIDFNYETEVYLGRVETEH